MEAQQFHDLAVLLLIAVVAPLLVLLSKRIRIPAVVLEIILGMLIGPYVLDWVGPEGVNEEFALFGLALLFFVAGLEIDPKRLRGRPARLAGISWAGSLAVALGIGAVLALSGVVLDSLVVGLALTTTALGTLMPILRDSGELDSEFGTYVIANGAMGELLPILAVALLLAGQDPGTEVLVLVGFALVIAGVALAAHLARPAWLDQALRNGLHSTNQLPVRICLLLVAVLVWIAAELGLDFLLGAVAAGAVVRFAIERNASELDADLLTEKIEGVSFGLFIPIFFVQTGVKFDFSALFSSAGTVLKVPIFLGLMLLARAVPTYLVHRDAVAGRSRTALALFAATALPLIVAITTIGVETGRMRTTNAAALVAAGMLSVLIFPIVASALHKSQKLVRPAPAPEW